MKTNNAFLKKAVDKIEPRQFSELNQCVLDTKQLLERHLQPRGFLIEGFLLERSAVMLWGPRGVGKTFFLLSMAQSLVTGTEFLGQPVPEERRVLYIDGEMSVLSLQERMQLICAGNPSEKLKFLCSEDVCDLLGRYLNLNQGGDQKAVEYILRAFDEMEDGEYPDVVILDNLSSLCAGKDENSNTEQENFLSFIRMLRHAGMTVIFVHHAGKADENNNYKQRGASRREDALDYIFGLKEDPKPENTAFSLLIDKCREKRMFPKSSKCELVETSEGLRVVLTKIPLAKKIAEIIRKHNPSTQMQIAEALKISPQAISNCMKENGLKLNGRINLLINPGQDQK